MQYPRLSEFQCGQPVEATTLNGQARLTSRPRFLPGLMSKPQQFLAVSALMMGFPGGYSAPVQAAGVVVAAGGGSEGSLGDTSAWSYRLYKKLILNGDINGDGKISVAILSAHDETDFLPRYFRWLGAQEASNIKVASRTDANDSTLLLPVKNADVIFIKGGDQSLFYDLWNESLLESLIRAVVTERQGAIGGTSAGAVSLAQYCFAGGQELLPAEVLSDAQTPSLEDTGGGSGIHANFLTVVPNVLIDAHETSRGRLGRLAGLLGKAVQDSGSRELLAIGLDERTGIALIGTQAEVIGQGAVELLQQTPSSQLRREKGRPLVYSDLRLDRLTDGWRFDLSTRLPDTAQLPGGVSLVVPSGVTGNNAGALTLRGSDAQDEGHFQRTVAYDPYPFSTAPGDGTPYIRNGFGIINAHNSDYRGAAHEAVFRALYEFPAYSGFLIAESGQVSRTARAADLLTFERNAGLSYHESSTLVVSGKWITHRGLSPYVSNEDVGSGRLNAAALVNLRLHVLGDSEHWGFRYDSREQAVVGVQKP